VIQGGAAIPGLAEIVRATVQQTLAALCSSGVDVSRLTLADSSIADTRGSSIPTEELMNRTYYRWVSKPVTHKKRFRVWFRQADGHKGYRDFGELAEATTWADGERRHVLQHGHPVGLEVDR
jgi:hypothetical protein